MYQRRPVCALQGPCRAYLPERCLTCLPERLPRRLSHATNTSSMQTCTTAMTLAYLAYRERVKLVNHPPKGYTPLRPSAGALAHWGPYVALAVPAVLSYCMEGWATEVLIFMSGGVHGCMHDHACTAALVCARGRKGCEPLRCRSSCHVGCPGPIRMGHLEHTSLHLQAACPTLTWQWG